MKRTFISLMLCLSFALLLAACGGASDNTTNTTTSNTTNANRATTNAPATTTTTNSTSTTSTTNTTASSGGGDKLGIPECDEYIAKYEACVNSKVPEAQRAQVKTTLDQSRAAWRTAAATPQGKASLPGLCKQAMEMARTSMKSYGCDF